MPRPRKNVTDEPITYTPRESAKREFKKASDAVADWPTAARITVLITAVNAYAEATIAELKEGTPQT